MTYYRIDPATLIPANATRHQRELLALFAVVTAGKRATVAAQTTEKALKYLEGQVWPLRSLASPFTLVNVGGGILGAALRHAGTGRYSQIATAWRGLAVLDIETATVAELELVPFVGPKTSRFIRMQINRSEQVAALDVHILNHLRDAGVEGVPTNTPRGRHYARLETEFLRLARIAGMTPRDYDISIWNAAQEAKQHV